MRLTEAAQMPLCPLMPHRRKNRERRRARAKADRSMLYTMESASEAGAASYNVSADELGRFVEMLSDGASESAMPEAAADESRVVGSEYNNVCVYIYGGRVLYSTDGGGDRVRKCGFCRGGKRNSGIFAG